MTITHPFLAQDTLPVDMVSAPWQKMDATTRDILIILGAVALVTLLALFWAVAFRSRKRRHHSHHHHHRHHHSHDHTEESSAPVSEEETVSEPTSRRKRRRHRRREHRPRNPTLAETGGLPPLRSAPPPEP
jgi:FtsZ-interacting cell division protein ZipA